MRLWPFALFLAPVLASAQNPPVAKRVPSSRTIHGETLVDNYKWLEKKEDPAVIRYLEQENDYYDSQMKPLDGLAQKINKEIVSRIKETDLEAPVFENGYWYYSRTVQGRQYPIHCRRKGTMKAKEEILLDLNQLNKGHEFTEIEVLSVSPDNRYLAYSVDHTGFREYELQVKDLRSPRKAPQRFGKVAGMEWAADSRTMFYVTEDKAKRPCKLYRQKLGSKTKTLVYEEKDEAYYFWVNKTQDRKFILLNSASKEESETQFIPASKPDSKPKLIAPRRTEFEYDVDHHGNLFYIRTNQPDAENFRLVVAPDTDPSEKNWKQILAAKPGVMLEDVDLYKTFMVLGERSEGFARIRVVDLKSGVVRTIPTPEAVGSIELGANPEFDTTSVRFSYTSYQNPNSTMSFDVRTGGVKMLKMQEVLGGYKTSDYVTELHWATARDGEKIPITLVRKKTTEKSANTPLLLEGYGSYGVPSDPYFSVSRLSLLNRGVIVATAHIRGGGEFGTRWRDQGKMAAKMNTFTDFIDCADWLKSSGYTSKDKLIIEGASAGGLLVGAVINMRPDLCKAAHLGVPFVDVINTMLNPDLPLTVGEYLEWGNPNKAKEYGWMRAYSPYDNIQAVRYPNMLVTTSLNDSQVMYHEPAKWTAKMRATMAPGAHLIMRCVMAGGHGGASGRYDAYRLRAEELAWYLNQFGIKN